jgi:hypothetical protein
VSIRTTQATGLGTELAYFSIFSGSRKAAPGKRLPCNWFSLWYDMSPKTTSVYKKLPEFKDSKGDPIIHGF